MVDLPVFFNIGGIGQLYYNPARDIALSLNKRLLDKKHGVGNWSKGSRREYSKLQKAGERNN